MTMLADDLLLRIIADLGDNAYGVPIYEALAAAGHPVSIGKMYTALEKLEAQGIVTSWMADPTPERGGRAKRYYRVNEVTHAAE